MRLQPFVINAAYRYPCLRTFANLAIVRDELLSRPPNITYDYLSPTPSHLLAISLANFLPASCYPRCLSVTEPLPLEEPIDRTASGPFFLPQGHHIVYFSPPVPNHALLPDGTDALHSPAEPTPFIRRLWAGGDLSFNSSTKSRLRLDGSRAICVESIKDVTIRGTEGAEKIFVHIERRIGHLEPKMQSEDQIIAPEAHPVNHLHKNWAVLERRDLVFMREEPFDDVKQNIIRGGRTVKPPRNADFNVTLTPPHSLLFRFSALTFNAHKIHLDSQYTKEVEGHRNLLVHGPLSLVLMLSVLRSQLKQGEFITNFSYRNVAPLYAQEEMKICLRRKTSGNDYEVWIESKKGGYAVKGSASIGRAEPA